MTEKKPQPGEWWRIDGKVNASGRELLHYFHAVAIVDCVSVGDYLVWQFFGFLFHCGLWFVFAYRKDGIVASILFLTD